MKNTLEMLKALNKHLCSLCRNPAELCLNTLSQAKSAVCAAQRGRAGSFPRLYVAIEFVGIYASCLLKRGVSQRGCAWHFAQPSGAGAVQQGAVPAPLTASPAPGPPTHGAKCRDEPLHPHPSKCEASFVWLSSISKCPQVTDEVWVLRKVWPSSETSRRSFTIVDLLLSSIGLDSHTTPGY